MKESFAHLPIVGSTEEALSEIATHRCRNREMDTAISPRVCELRKGKRGNPMDNAGFDPFWQCFDCEGPIPIERRGGVNEERPKYRCIWPGCGLEQNEPGSEFYRTSYSRCKVHHGMKMPVTETKEEVVVEPVSVAESKAVMVVFNADDTELYESLCRIAKRERRSPENQLLVILEAEIANEEKNP